MSRPISLPLWATGSGALIVEPSASLKASGWAPLQVPPAEFFNYEQNLIGSWVEYLSGSEVAISSSFWPLSSTVATLSSSEQALSSLLTAVSSTLASASFAVLTGTVVTGTTALFQSMTGSNSGALTQGTTGSFLSLTASVLPTSGSATRSLSDVAYGALAYDMVFSAPGVPSGTLARIVLARPVTVPTDASGSIGSVGTNPATASAVQIQQNGVSVITASIATNGVVTFANTASIAFARGDVVTLAYTGSDPSLSDVSITLVGAL